MDAADEMTEKVFLERMNKLNDNNSQLLKDSNKVMGSMKNEANKWKRNEDLKDEPEARIMQGVVNALQTEIYKTLRLSQNIQMDIKVICKQKISRHVEMVDPDLSKEQVEE